MKQQNLAQRFAEAREAKSLSMLATANKCDLAETTVWKIENGRSVRWETVHLVLTAGLGIPAGTKDYEAFHALWLRDRQDRAERKPEGSGKKRMSKAAVAAVRKFRKIVHDMNEKDILMVVAAAKRAASKNK